MSAGPARLLRRTRATNSVEGWEVTDEYQVFTTDSSDTALDVLGASGLPSLYSSSPFDPLSVVTSQTPIRQEDATNHWHVEVTYSRQKASDQDQQNPPTLRPCKRSFSVRWVEFALMKDKDDDPILTSAKTPFNPPLTTQEPHIVLTFQRWETEFNPLVTAALGAVNSTTWSGFLPGKVLCTNIQGSEEWEQDADGNLQRYWTITYEFEVAAPGKFWNPTKILDCDYWFIDPNDSLRKPIFVDKNGVYHGDPDDANGATPVPSPVPLKGSGDVGDVLQASELPDDAHYLEFNLYDEVDFNELALPVYL